MSYKLQISSGVTCVCFGKIGTIQAWRETPEGLLFYVSFKIGESTVVHWLDSSDVKLLES